MRTEAVIVEAIAREAGAILKRHWGALPSVEKKGSRDLVTVADRASEAHVIARIREEFPSDAILAEETLQDVRSDGRLWIVDPLDGTTNFVHRIPHVAVSVALCVDRIPLVGCVYNPILDECFVASRGEGARRDGQVLEVRRTTTLSDALLSSGFHYHREEKLDSNFQHFTDLGYLVRGLRRLGSAACDLCYVADGRYDGYWELHLSPWDVAAGGLIASEAGAQVTDLSGGPDWLFGEQIVAANPPLATEILRVIASADPKLLPGPRAPR